MRSLPIRFLTLLALGALAALFAAAPATAQILSDDFESYAIGAHPGAPWITIFDGESAYITDAHAHSGAKSFCIRSLPNWSRWEVVNVGTLPDQVGYQGAVMVETAGRGGAIGFGFVVPGVPNEGRWSNAVAFGNDGVLRFSTRTHGDAVLGSWNAGQWYVIGVYLDFVNELASVYVDDVLVAANLPADPKVLPGPPAIPLDQFGILGDNFSGDGVGTMYLDGAFVGDPAVSVAPVSWGAIKRLYR